MLLGFYCWRNHLLGGLLLLLLFLLGVSFVLFWYWFRLRRWWGSLLLFLLFLSNEQADNIFCLDHVVFINLEFTEDVVNLSLGHLVPPGHQGMCEHLGVNLTLKIISLESLDDEVVRVVALSSHLLLEHLYHVVVVAGAANLAQQLIEFSFCHEDTNIVESSTKIIFVDCAILVDVHQLKALSVHLQLLLGEASLILSLPHSE